MLDHTSLIVRTKKRLQRRFYKLIHGHPKWFDFPTTLQIDTHNYCNLECIYCNPQGAFDIPRGTMPMSTIEYILEYFKGYQVDFVKPFMNGDGLLEKRLPKITRLSKEKIPYAKTETFTNGIAYENRELLVDENLDIVRFTISAATTKMYEYIHGKPYMHRALSTLDWFDQNKEANQEIIINFVLTGDNAGELELWKNLFSKFRQDIRPLHSGLGQTSSIKAKAELSLEEACGLARIPFPLTFSEDRPCSAWTNLAFSWDGRVLHCCTAPYTQNYGMVGEVDLLEVWKKQYDIGLDRQCCKACNYKDSNWKSAFEKYGIGDCD